MARKSAASKKCALEPEPFSIWVDWEYTHISGGEVCEGQEDDDDDYPSLEDEYKDHEIHGVYSVDATNSRGWSRYNERCEVSFQPVRGAEVFLVIVTYSSGNTFGHSSGNVTVVGCYEEQAQADAIESDIWADDIGADRDYKRNLKRSEKERFTGYKAWTGYFEGLEGVVVHRLTLDDPEN